MRLRRPAPSDVDAPGQDSFLDIVANLVGILVILIMVIGVRAQGALSGAADEAVTAGLEAAKRHLQAAQEKVLNLTRNVLEIEQKSQQLDRLVQQRQAERDQLQLLATAAKTALQERQQQLDEVGREQMQLRQQLRQLKHQLQQVNAARLAVEHEADQPVELQHLPTPLAETVFGQEEHFRLKAGKLLYVPLNQLTQKLQAEAPKKIWKLKDHDEMTETIGPVQDFLLRYTLERKAVATPSQAGPIVRQMVQLRRFVLVPTPQAVGVPLETALQPDSNIQLLLDSFDPGSTVITVWTYPDSFAEFRQLKQYLYQQGFATAARPLPEGQPISGAPTGTRSAAQ